MKGDGLKKRIIYSKSFFILSSILFLLSFVLAAHVITISNGDSINEDLSSFINISVNNGDSNNVTANISQVDIILPSNFTFTAESNGTDVGSHTFSNTSTTLTWSNDAIVLNGTTQYFQFNVTSTTPGVYDLEVNTTNATGVYSTNLSITVNDTTDPSSVAFVSPTPSDLSNVSTGNIEANVTGMDNGVISAIVIRLYNSTQDQINTSSSSTSPAFVNFTGLSDGVYYLNATVNDTAGNSNDTTTTRNITIDTEDPVVTLISPSSGTSATTTSYNFTFNVTDNGGIASCDLIIDNSSDSTLSTIANGTTHGITSSTLSEDSHIWSVNCTDSAGNVAASSSRTVTVTASSSTSSSSSGGGSSTQVFYPGTTTLSSGYTKDYAAGWKTQFDIAGSSHSMRLDSFDYDDQEVTVTISSNPQTKTLGIGEIWKVDVDGDGDYYDLEVSLTKVTTLRGTVILTSISELIPENEKIQDSQESSEPLSGASSSDEDKVSGSENADAAGTAGEGLAWYWWVLIIFLILAAIITAVFTVMKNKKINEKAFGK